jgi:hypothetical protein
MPDLEGFVHKFTGERKKGPSRCEGDHQENALQKFMNTFPLTTSVFVFQKKTQNGKQIIKRPFFSTGRMGRMNIVRLRKDTIGKTICSSTCA